MKTLSTNFTHQQLKEKRLEVSKSIKFIRHSLGDYWDALSKFEKGRLKDYLELQKIKAKNYTKIRNELKKEHIYII